MDALVARLLSSCGMSTPSRLISAALLVGLLAVGAAPRSAHAQGDFERHLNAAARLYASLDYERALTQINLARGMPHGSDQEVELSLYEGIIQAELGQQDTSVAAFKSALLVRPEARLPLKVAPKVNGLFESVRKQVKRELAAIPPKPPAEPPKTATVLSVQPPPPASSIPPSTASPTGVADQGHAQRDLRRYALIPAIAGGALVVSGGISWAVSRGELNRLRTNDASIGSTEDVQHSVSRGRTWQTLGVTLLGVGTAGLATAAGLYFLGEPHAPVAVGLSTDGTSAFVYGRWP
jgi:hypothetical protein